MITLSIVNLVEINAQQGNNYRQYAKNPERPFLHQLAALGSRKIVNLETFAAINMLSSMVLMMMVMFMVFMMMLMVIVAVMMLLILCLGILHYVIFFILHSSC